MHHFVIPGLYQLTESDLSFLDEKAYPSLTQFFQNAKEINTQTDDLDSVVCHKMGGEHQLMPCAQAFSQDPNVIIATPILLKADINSTWILPASESEHIDTILFDLEKFFHDDLTILKSYHGHYIFKFKSCQVLTHLPHYLSVMGKKIDGFQEGIRENLPWFKLINEIQMFIHGHALNTSEEGMQLFNSLWFWGGDSAQTKKNKHSLTSDDHILNKAFKQDVNSDDTIRVKLDLLKVLKLNKAISIEDFFSALEDEFSPLNLQDVTMDTVDGQQLIYSPLKSFLFWQKKQTCKSLLMSRINS